MHKNKQQKLKISFETDEKGKHKVIEQSNGIKIRLLREPSKEYLKKKKDGAMKIAEKEKIEQAKRDEEKMIRNKMRELAITELKKEGKI